MTSAARLLDLHEDDGDNFNNAIRGLLEAPDMFLIDSVEFLVQSVVSLREKNLEDDAFLATRFSQDNPDAILTQNEVAAIRFHIRAHGF